MKAIEVHALFKTFLLKKGDQLDAVKGITFSLDPGEVFGFLGPNGAGKSTTIKMLMGLIRPTAGRVLIMGDDANLPRTRKHVGYLPENPAFYDYLTAAEYLTFVSRTFGMAPREIQSNIETVLRDLDLWEARKRPIRSYSKGMVQRLGLAQTLIHDPDVFILDEPMSGLDPIGRAHVKEVILDLKERGKSIFFSTHITSDVESICDRVGILARGELKRIDRVDSLLREGIVGYRITLQGTGALERIPIEVEKHNLQNTLRELQEAGKEIVLIEPKRKNLEEFFLDVVEGKA